MSQPLEPTPQNLPQSFMRYLLATRPAFLTMTFVACLLGFATADFSGITLDILNAGMTLLFALLAHAGANVVNDYHDAKSGCDAANVERIYPFTGGSRMVQNGVLTTSEIGFFGHALLVIVIPAGLWLSTVSAPGLIAIGFVGLLIGWAYSAPPCKLQARGIGEFGITAAWLLIVIGSDFVQRLGFSFAPVASGLGFALLVANVLYINQFPDIKADASVGKLTMIVRLGVKRARWGYLLIALLSYSWVTLMVITHHLPALTLISLIPSIFSFRAAQNLAENADKPSQLVTGIKHTILAASLHGLLLAAALVVSTIQN